MSLLFDAFTCGLLAALTWAGLVWMSPSSPVQNVQGWWQGAGTLAMANALIWLGLASFVLHWPAWAVIFFTCNALIGRFVFAFFESIRIPNIWSMLIHPLAIAVMSLLLGGALGAIR